MKIMVMATEVFKTKKGNFVANCVQQMEGGKLGIVKVFIRSAEELPADGKTHAIEVKVPQMYFAA